ncbi:MAG: hypothetical protein V1678_02950 [Candidatus Aenigmatarchaeota archaeon]
MTTVLKINQGTAERLLQWNELKPDQSRNLSGKDLTLEVHNSEIIVEPCKENNRNMLEISDTEGSFGLWLDLTSERIQKLKSILDKF